MSRLVVVSLWFQLIWFMAVLGQYSWQWLTVILGIVTFGYAVVSDAPSLVKTVLLTLSGVILDWLNIQTGVFEFKTEFVPLWLAVLWFAFIWYARQWMPYIAQYSKGVIIVFVGCCGALSYWAGYRFEAVEFPLSVLWTLAILMVQWSCVAWLILKVFSDAKSTSVSFADNSAQRNKS